MTCLHVIGQRQVVDIVQQGSVQAAIGQGTSVEDRVAFAARGDQAGLGQDLEVVAHARLADGEDLRQFQHAERIVAQCAQHVEAQRITAGLAQGGELVAGVELQLGCAQGHGGAV
jgi:hypothetical protein